MLCTNKNKTYTNNKQERVFLCVHNYINGERERERIYNCRELNVKNVHEEEKKKQT